MIRKVFILVNLEAAFDYLGFEEIDADLAVIPLDVDDLTVEDDLNNKDTATPLVDDVPGLVKVVNADEEDCSDVPYTSAVQTLRQKSSEKKDEKLLGKRKIPLTAIGQACLILSLQS